SCRTCCCATTRCRWPTRSRRARPSSTSSSPSWPCRSRRRTSWWTGCATTRCGRRCATSCRRRSSTASARTTSPRRPASTCATSACRSGCASSSATRARRRCSTRSWCSRTTRASSCARKPTSSSSRGRSGSRSGCGSSRWPHSRTVMENYEQLGVLYLGRRHDPEKGPLDEPLLYDARDLTTHALIVGMTGSGKTGLGVGLLEELAIDGIPAIAIDPKGDLGNLALNFPGLSGPEFRPWIDEDEAARAGRTPEAQAAAVAQQWAEGLAESHQDAARMARLRAAAEVTIYTPGSSAGIPLSILRSLAAPSPAPSDDDELRRERVASTASSLLALLGIDSDPRTGREHILLARLVADA